MENIHAQLSVFHHCHFQTSTSAKWRIRAAIWGIVSTPRVATVATAPWDTRKGEVDVKVTAQTQVLKSLERVELMTLKDVSLPDNNMLLVMIVK